MAADDPLARARTLTRLLDSAAKIPGTGIRFGLDPLLAGYLVLLAQRLGAPRSVIVRMLANVAVDTVGGTVPLVGDAFDVAFKSNTRKLALLERTLAVPARDVERASRVAVIATLVGLALLAIGGLVLAVFVIRWLVGAASAHWCGGAD
jgi:hypothetical protein